MRRRPLLVLITLAALLQGCIITYRDFPDAQIKPVERPKTQPRVYFSLDSFDTHFDKLFQALIRDNSYFSGVERILDPSVSPTPESAVPAKGLYLRVQFIGAPVSPGRKMWLTISSFTAGIIPYWSGDAGYINELGETTTQPSQTHKVRIRVYKNGAEQRVFEYGYRQRVVQFILLAPFSFINFWTDYGDEVLTGIFNQFLNDAQPVFAQAAREANSSADVAQAVK